MDIFSEHIWFGDFFFPDDYDNRFSGKLNFSPESGIELFYLISSDAKLGSTDVLHGILETGEACTLFGKFSTDHSGFTVKQGFSSKKGSVAFSFLVIGDHLSVTPAFQEIIFSLSSMEEFFVPKDFKAQVKYKKEPLLTWSLPYGRLEVGLSATFNLVGSDITSRIYSQNDAANTALQAAYRNVQEENPNAFFMHRERISYHAYLKTNELVGCEDLYRHISNLAGLFAILVNAPVHPEEITVNLPGNGEYLLPTKINLLPSISLDSRTIALAKHNRSHFNMPLTNSTINLESVVKKWLEMPQKNTIIVSSIQHETGFRTEHAAHGDIVLYATQLEAISYAESAKERKYQYPIERYGGRIIAAALKNIALNYGVSDIGILVSDLRNDIAHVGRPKKLLSKFTLRDLVRVSRMLQLTVLGNILHQLGIDQERLDKYMNAFCPKA